MRCEHCQAELPNDSRFCQFCGKTLSLPPDKPPVPPLYAKDPAFKATFCRRCGKPIDEETKRCFGCGRQYFRGVPPLAFLCIVLALAVIGLMVACITQEIAYHARIDELEQLVDLYKTHVL